ncbi:hypothetical protein JXA32_04470 [Candidatus Sumerlaeota bacterium]|nr:hypothetical protein [Candidatus Sumerlaeota bacterium]
MRLEKYPDPKDSPLLGPRLWAVKTAAFLFALAFLFQLYRLCILHGDELFAKSEDNFLKLESIEPQRGLITDRNRQILAFNRSNYRFFIGRFQQSSDELARTTREVGRLLNRDLSEPLERVKHMRRFDVQLIADRVQPSQALPIIERWGALPGLIVRRSNSRQYAYSMAISHALGYTGLLNPTEFERLQDKGYERTDYIGKTGLEREYEAQLRGEKGWRIVARDSRMRVRETVQEQAAKAGDNLMLTIDADLQQEAYELLSGFEHPACAIIMNPQNGEVLALASHFSFDLNDPAQGINDSVRKPHWNRAVSETYPPGSTFKAIAASCALRLGWDPERTVFCDSRYYLPNWNTPFRCNAKWGHGEVNLEQALRSSCNEYFYNIGFSQTYGDTHLLDMAREFGLGELTHIDLPEGVERPGKIPRAYQYNGDRIQTAIGQWHLEVTPLQMITAYCAIGNGGQLVQPHLLKRVESRDGEVMLVNNPPASRSVDVSDRLLRIVRSGLWLVCNDRKGTAYRDRESESGWKRLFPEEWQAFGKTATATRGFGENQFDDAWFIGLAPLESPKVAAIVVIERGGHGGETAAPLVKHLMAAYFRKFGGVPEETLIMPERDVAPEKLLKEETAPDEEDDGQD